MSSAPKTKHDWSLVDQELIQCYQTGNRTKLLPLSIKTGIPVTTLSFRALNTLNLTRRPVIKKPRPYWYSAEEDQILIANSMHSTASIAKKLVKAGFKRTCHSIENRLSALRAAGKLLRIQEEIEDRDLITVPVLAEEMGINECKVLRWINLGYLKEKVGKRNNARTRRHLLHRKEVREFLIFYQRFYDHALCRHGFLVDMLAGEFPLMLQHSCGVKDQ